MALIRTDQPIAYGEHAGDVNGRRVGVGPICVPKRGDRYSGMVTVAGWGGSRTRKNEPTLRYVHLRLLNISSCPEARQRERVKPDKVEVPGDEEPQLCAGYIEGVKSPCHVCCFYS